MLCSGKKGSNLYMNTRYWYQSKKKKKWKKENCLSNFFFQDIRMLLNDCFIPAFLGICTEDSTAFSNAVC